MKTERVTLLTSPEFKKFLAAEARHAKVSVAELVRSRCEGRPGADEAVLIALTAQLRTVVAQAKKSLREGLAAADAVLADLRAQRVNAPAARRTRKAQGKLAA
jgi:hypothetical protein